MKIIIDEFNNLFADFHVEKLDENNLNDIFCICQNNVYYYKCLKETPTIFSVKTILEEVPPNKNFNDKFVLGFFENNKLVAILDLVKDYPKSNNIFIGLFIIDVYYQNKGIGSKVIKRLINILKTIGVSECYLGVVDSNEKAYIFWKKQGFEETGKIYNHEKYNVIMMMKKIK